jgi:hypothetical protein
VTLRFSALAVGLLVLAGCAGNRPVDVTLPRPSVRADAPAVRIGAVQDARVFTPYARDGQPMSLAPGVPDEPAARARVVGRRRSAQGISQDNVLLAEGRTVNDLVAEATRLGLERAGYRVLEPGEPGWERAPALALVIRRFWTRMVWRALLSYEFRAEVHLVGPLAPFSEGAWVCGTVNVGRAGPSAGVWPHTLRVGLEDYANNVFERLAWRALPPHCGRISRPGQPGPPEGDAGAGSGSGRPGASATVRGATRE